MTTKNVVGVYRGMAHWHRLSSEVAVNGWGLELEPELKPPRGSDFALDISPPPPYGPQDFAIEVTFTKCAGAFSRRSIEGMGFIPRWLWIVILVLLVLIVLAYCGHIHGTLAV